MKPFRLARMLPLVAFFLGGINAVQAQDVLTGDTRLACEAVLCLSSSTRPGECAPALSRYFGIKFDKHWDTVKARIDFLNMCPAHNEPGMPSLITAIANGAGQCDAPFLNQYNRVTMERTTCSRPRAFQDKKCTTTTVSLISNKKPAYCQIYESHEYTDLNTHYVGDMYSGGLWADAGDHDQVLQEYNDNYQPVSNNTTYSTPDRNRRNENDSR